MGNCGTRDESAVISGAHLQVQQLQAVVASSRNPNPVKDRKYGHGRSTIDPADPCTGRNLEDSQNNSVLYTHVIPFTLFELETITKSFRSDYILGEGGFGTVYKGYIDENVRVGLKSLPVAVKVLNKGGLQGHREWLTEVNFLGQLRHPNLVKLIGYCCEDDHRLLVYEFMFRGSLENHLFRSNLSFPFSGFSDAKSSHAQTFFFFLAIICLVGLVPHILLLANHVYFHVSPSVPFAVCSHLWMLYVTVLLIPVASLYY